MHFVSSVSSLGFEKFSYGLRLLSLSALSSFLILILLGWRTVHHHRPFVQAQHGLRFVDSGLVHDFRHFRSVCFRVSLLRFLSGCRDQRNSRRGLGVILLESDKESKKISRNVSLATASRALCRLKP